MRNAVVASLGFRYCIDVKAPTIAIVETTVATNLTEDLVRQKRLVTIL